MPSSSALPMWPRLPAGSRHAQEHVRGRLRGRRRRQGRRPADRGAETGEGFESHEGGGGVARRQGGLRRPGA
eukprot:5102825-Pyramimonas_sp.AAC.1